MISKRHSVPFKANRPSQNTWKTSMLPPISEYSNYVRFLWLGSVWSLCSKQDVFLRLKIITLGGGGMYEIFINMNWIQCLFIESQSRAQSTQSHGVVFKYILACQRSLLTWLFTSSCGFRCRHPSEQIPSTSILGGEVVQKNYKIGAPLTSGGHLPKGKPGSATGKHDSTSLCCLIHIASHCFQTVL